MHFSDVIIIIFTRVQWCVSSDPKKKPTADTAPPRAATPRPSGKTRNTQVFPLPYLRLKAVPSENAVGGQGIRGTHWSLNDFFPTNICLLKLLYSLTPKARFAPSVTEDRSRFGEIWRRTCREHSWYFNAIQRWVEIPIGHTIFARRVEWARGKGGGGDFKQTGINIRSYTAV